MPCVKGTRITIGEMLEHLATDAPEAELLANYPQLKHDDVLAGFASAAAREHGVVVALASASADR